MSESEMGPIAMWGEREPPVIYHVATKREMATVRDVEVGEIIVDAMNKAVVEEGQLSKVREELGLAQQERDEAKAGQKEGRRVWTGFIRDCAKLLGLPELDKNTEYGGGAIRKGIEALREKVTLFENASYADAVQGEAAWKGRAEVAEKALVKNDEENAKLYKALSRINDLRNDIIRRQSVGHSRHVYPLVSALEEAGFDGESYPRMGERLEATIAKARELVAVAWCTKETENRVMDVDLADAFAQILFPFLEALDFYARLGNWQGDKGGFEDSACERDLGDRARAVMSTEKVEEV